MKTQKSMITHIIKINVTLIAIHLVLFAGISIFFNCKLAAEEKALSTTILASEMSAFQGEQYRLNTLMARCINDPSFIFAITDRLDERFFYENAVRTAEKLSIIHQSLPYSVKVFAYSKKNDRIISDSGSIHPASAYPQAEATIATTTVTKPLILSGIDGLTTYDGKLYYKKSLFDYGYIAIQIDPEKYAGIGGSILGNGYVFIINAEQNICVGEATNGFAQSVDWKSLRNRDTVEVNKTIYSVTAEPLGASGYYSLLLENHGERAATNQYFHLAVLAALSILLMTSAAMLFLNIKVYLPLKKFTVRHGNILKSNEISFMENKINEMLEEIHSLSERKDEAGLVWPEKMALRYLLYGGTDVSSMQLEPLRKKYSSYHMLMLIVQNQDGEPIPSVAAALEKSLHDANLQFIFMDSFTTAIIVANSTPENFLEQLRRHIPAIPETAQIYAGISTNCTDITQLYKESSQATTNLMAAQFSSPTERFHCVLNALPLDSVGLSDSQQSTVYEFTSNGAFEPLEKLLQKLLIEHSPTTLGSYVETYRDITHQLRRVIHEKRFHLKQSIPNAHLYHTGYMYQSLMRLISEMKIHYLTGAVDMKSQIYEYIQDNLTSPLSLEQVADAFSITPVYLSSWFKKNFGVNFSTYISALRMDIAAGILKNNESMKVYEVAKLVGIENVTTFIRQFKAKTGTTPEQYRKNTRN